MDTFEKLNRVNLVYFAYMLGQLSNKDLTPAEAEKIVECVKKFTYWENCNVFSLVDGWASYIADGGNDYESEIMNWVKKYIEEH